MSKNFFRRVFFMKKLKILFIPFLICAAFCGCESSTSIRVASLSEITAAGSSDYAARIEFADDDRLEEKEYDIQIRSDTENLKLTFWRENDQKITSTITVSNRWYSLTSIKVDAAGLSGQEKFKKLKDAVSESYIFNVSAPCKLTFRVVAGEATENSAGTGQILANVDPVSDELIIECKDK